MNFGLNDDQQMLRETFARFLNAQSSMARVRQANQAGGFDPELWLGLAELGAFVESKSASNIDQEFLTRWLLIQRVAPPSGRR
jgi:hypothetical protein